MKPETIMIDEQKYVREDCVDKQATQLDGMNYCIIRTYSAGVFAGYLESREGKEVTLRNSRGIWYWDGACGLSQLAKDGTVTPDNCKFTVEVEKRDLTEVVEVIFCTEKARKSIQAVAIWKS